MGMVMLGMFALNPVGVSGSIIQQLNTASPPARSS